MKRSNQSFEERHQLAHVKTDGKDGRQMSRQGEQAREERQSVIPHLLDCLPEMTILFLMLRRVCDADVLSVIPSSEQSSCSCLDQGLTIEKSASQTFATTVRFF